MKQLRPRPVLRYHGGKFLLAPWIISFFPPHKIYVEPFGGAASVLMRKPRSYSEVYNDKWDMVVHVFRVMRDPNQAAMLKRMIELTPYSRTEFMQSGDEHLKLITDPIEKARLIIFRSFAGFGSAATNARYATGFRANANRSGTTPAHDWENYPRHIENFTERLRAVVIESKESSEIIDIQDSRETLFYLDPPYMHDTRDMRRGNASYACEMTDDDHVRLSHQLHNIKGMAVLSGYENDLYNALYMDWKVIKKSTFGDGAAKRIECLWLNQAAKEKLNPQLF